LVERDHAIKLYVDEVDEKGKMAENGCHVFGQ
jgi:hypothetical protein